MKPSNINKISNRTELIRFCHGQPYPNFLRVRRDELVFNSANAWPSIVSLYYWKIILIKQKIKGKIDSTGRFINNLRTKEEDDDAWSLEDDNEEYFERNKTKQNSFKLKFDKFINMLPLTTTTPKHTNEELEMAEKMAAMIVQDVVNQNNHLN